MNTNKILYPLKFVPILKERVWGGERLMQGKNYGESWELSGLCGDISVVENGFLKGQTLCQLIESYTNDLVGNKIYDIFGNQFPILIKFIDTIDDLSVQVHPDDKMAAAEHGQVGKTEMWYIIDSENDSKLIVGFNQDMDEEKYIKAVADNKITEFLNIEHVNAGDVVFLPAGRIHALGKNIFLAEIQQTSDITYRIYDWDRLPKRQMHTELAAKALDYRQYDNYKTEYEKQQNGTSELVDCQYFTTNIINFEKLFEKDYQNLGSFVIYICTSGCCTINWGTADNIEISKGETILIPACIKKLNLIPSMPTELLEVFLRK
jgi:mannose-6-phosphate isomerase